MNYLSLNNGQTALPTILLIVGIIFEIAIGFALITYLLLTSGYGERLSAEALAASRAGLSDALIKLARDKNFTSVSSYTVDVGSRSAEVTVVNDGAGRVTITSTGSAITRQRRVQAIYIVNQTTGKIDLESTTEIPL